MRGGWTGRPSGDVVVNCYTLKEVAGEALPQHLEKEIQDG